MSGIAVEWIPVGLFVLLLVGAVVGEVLWLVRRGWASSGTAVVYVLLTDLISLGVGFFVVFVLFFIIFMMVMGPAGRGGTAPESAYIATTLIAVIFPPAFLVTAKRLFLRILKIKSGKTAWIYSCLVSLLILIVVLIPPPLVFYLLTYLPRWK